MVTLDTSQYLRRIRRQQYLRAENSGLFGAVFDGRYVYFVPQHDGNRDGTVLRFDTHRQFRNPASWSAYDAEYSLA
jgi:hypothetical protein